MNKSDVEYVIGLYSNITIQTRNLTVNNLNAEKVEFVTKSLVCLKSMSNEDVYIDVEDIVAIYGKGGKL